MRNVVKCRNIALQSLRILYIFVLRLDVLSTFGSKVVIFTVMSILLPTGFDVAGDDDKGKKSLRAKKIASGKSASLAATNYNSCLIIEHDGKVR